MAVAVAVAVAVAGLWRPALICLVRSTISRRQWLGLVMITVMVRLPVLTLSTILTHLIQRSEILFVIETYVCQRGTRHRHAYGQLVVNLVIE